MRKPHPGESGYTTRGKKENKHEYDKDKGRKRTTKKSFFLNIIKVRFPDHCRYINESALRASETILFLFFSYRGIRNKKLSKVKKFQVWVAISSMVLLLDGSLLSDVHVWSNSLFDLFRAFVYID